MRCITPSPIARAGVRLRIRHVFGLVGTGAALVATACSGGETPTGTREAGSGGAAGSGGMVAGAGGKAGAHDAGTGGNAGASGGKGGSDASDAGTEGGPQRTRVTLRAQPVDVVWAAFQDGSGAWQRLSGSNGVYTFDVANRYGVVAVCADSADADTFVHVLQATVDEVTELPVDCQPYAPRTMYQVSGTVGGVTGAAYVTVGVSTSFSSFTSPTSAPTYNTSLPPGTYDFLAFRGTGSSSDFSFDRMVIDRDVVVAGDLKHDVDVSLGGFAAAGPSHVDLLGAEPGEVLLTEVDYRTSRGTSVPIAQTSTAGLDYPLIPDAARVQGDLYNMKGGVSTPGGTGAYTSRGAARYLATPGIVGLTLPPAFNPTATRMGSTPYVRIRASLPAAAWASWFGLEYRTVQGAISKQWTTAITVGWLSGATSYEMPDFSTLPGWTQDFGLIGGTTQVDVDMGAHSSSGGYPATFAPPNDRDLQRYARGHMVL